MLLLKSPSYPLRNANMEKVNLPFFYDLGAELAALSRLEPSSSTKLEILVACYRASPNLEALLDSFPSLNVCRGVCKELKDLIRNCQQHKSEEWSRAPNFDPEEMAFRNVVTKAKDFAIVLTAELQNLPSYLPEQKGIYDTTKLIDEAERVLPASVIAKLSAEVIEELRQSGRCLAFDIGTACGFHMMRAVEGVLHGYYLAVCKPKPKPKERLDSWGAYIAALHGINEDDVKEVVAILQQLKDRHRNRLMHPEIILSPDDAFTLFETGQTAITVMAQRL